MSQLYTKNIFFGIKNYSFYCKRERKRRKQKKTLKSEFKKIKSGKEQKNLEFQTRNVK
jgi:hypothetical protein